MNSPHLARLFSESSGWETRSFVMFTRSTAPIVTFQGYAHSKSSLNQRSANNDDSMTLPLIIVLACAAALLWAMKPTTSSKGHSTVFHFPENPSLVGVRKKNEEEGVENRSLTVLLEERCPSLFSEYKPAWWLPNGHFQTIFSGLRNFTNEDQVWYRRTYLRLADGGTLGLDFTPEDEKVARKDAPIIVIQHGLSGGSHEPYIRAILSRACLPVSEGGLGYRAVVLNFRGCAGVPLTTPLFYSAGATDDTRQALMHIAHLYPDAPLLGLGFSLGSNVLTRYLAEEGDESRLQSACVLACPWDMKRNGDSLDAEFLGRHLWSKGMGRHMQTLIKRHTKVLLSDPNSEVAKVTRDAFKLRNPTLDKFDDTFTRVAGGPGAPFPFKDAASYYIWVSSHNVLDAIRVPFLAINSADDPVVKHVPTDGGGNGMVILGLTARGGHLGWFTELESNDRRWTTKPLLEWLKLVGDDLVCNPRSRGSLLYISDDGFLREHKNSHLGCKVIKISGSNCIINGNSGEQSLFEGL